MVAPVVRPRLLGRKSVGRNGNGIVVLGRRAGDRSRRAGVNDYAELNCGLYIRVMIMVAVKVNDDADAAGPAGVTTLSSR